MLTLYILIFLALSVLHVYFARRSSDPYGTFHLSFNKLHGGPDLPQTEWLNWAFGSAVFPEACQALALRLLRVAALRQNGRVLDVGHGSGDSILLQLSHPELAKPTLVCGVTYLPSHHRRTRQRVDGFLSSADALDKRPDVLYSRVTPFGGQAIRNIRSRPTLGANLITSLPSIVHTILTLARNFFASPSSASHPAVALP
ncbi:hypothetical protein BC827DRAFT_305297 [Russula dissimulans]|nr:hypothetical protein BC827DRAFT_305297 [Russula dissimulans]